MNCPICNQKFGTYRREYAFWYHLMDYHREIWKSIKCYFEMPDKPYLRQGVVCPVCKETWVSWHDFENCFYKDDAATLLAWVLLKCLTK